jgi:hypothetical protein
MERRWRSAMAWRSLLAISVGLILTVTIVRCSAAPTTTMDNRLSQIPGCTGIVSFGGATMDDSTVGRGSCRLTDGATLDIDLWPRGDTSDLERYVYLSSGNGCCYVGTSPQPWAITLDSRSSPAMTLHDNITSLPASEIARDWSAVEHAFPGEMVTNPPSSWSDGQGKVG